ncbi:MAG TPA: hypothetical protein DIT04_01835 [Dysgonomonas sp.]|nr:hypothetical protein [Dysgonomonas sp.]
MILKYNTVMKKVKFLTLVLMLVVSFSFSSCGTTNLGSKLKRIEIGMTKREVIDILGNTYDVIGARDTPDGALETLRYTNITVDGPIPYIVNFLDGKLVEWFKEPSNYPY